MLCLLKLRRLPVLAFGLFALPVVFWGAVLSLAPTDWARDRIVRRLAETTGRRVTLGRVRLGLCGGVRLENLAMAEPGRPDDPWLKVRSLAIDVNVGHLLAGKVEPTRVEADGVVLRARRDAGGTFEFHDLFRASPKHDPKPAGGDDPEAQVVAFRLADSRVVVEDAPTGTTLEFADLSGDGHWERGSATLDELKGTVNGGSFEMAAQLDRGASCPTFEVQVRIKDASLGKDMASLGYLVPMVAGKGQALDGKLGLTMYVRGQGDTKAMLRGSLAGQGAVSLDPIALDGSRFLDEIDDLLDLPRSARVGSVHGDLKIDHGRISSRNLRLRIGQAPIVFSGWTDFDGRLDYRVHTEALSARLAKETKGLLSDLPVAVDDLLEARISGRIDHLEVTIDGVPLNGNARHADGRPMDDRARVKALGRRLRDRLLR